MPNHYLLQCDSLYFAPFGFYRMLRTYLMDGWMDGWIMDGWMMDGWMDGLLLLVLSSHEDDSIRLPSRRLAKPNLPPVQFPGGPRDSAGLLSCGGAQAEATSRGFAAVPSLAERHPITGTPQHQAFGA
jgi:hypothetical protein